MSENKITLTDEEQIALVNGASFFGSSSIPEKNIPALQFLDGGTGINFEQLFGDFLSKEGRDSEIGGDTLRDVLENFYNPSALKNEKSRELYEWICERLKEIIPDMTPPGCYPPGIFLGATWNPDVVYKIGYSLGQEARAYGINILLGTPNVNIHRDIRNGRLFEGYSEDPCLVSSLAPELVKGVQCHGVAANVKHFAANHQETNRKNVNEFISERALREIYYPGFEVCVKAGVATVMSAYNQINSIPCSENRAMLNNLLREEWGFEGVVISDWGAVINPDKAINAGNDLAMPGPIAPDRLIEAYENRTLSKSALETSSQRIADLARKFGKPCDGKIDIQETNKSAYETAAEGIILLKNDCDALPLEVCRGVSLFGRHSEYLLTCGEGSAGIITNRNVSFKNALCQHFGNVSHNEFCENSDTFIYVYSLPGQEGNDRSDISIQQDIRDEIDSLVCEANKREMKKILILNVSSPVALDGIDEKFDGIFCVFLPGMQGAQALADCLCGKINPSGKLPLSWCKRIEDTPSYLNFPGDGMQVHYGEGIFVGYRWYDARKINPLYPFGYGLSYTSFRLSEISTDRDTFNDLIEVKVTVKNTGRRDGKTVVQLYVSDNISTLTKPVRELKAFKKIFLKAGEEKTIPFRLCRHDFESFDPNLMQWIMEEGYYTLSAGLSSQDIQAECTVYADIRSPYSYGEQTSVKTIFENEALRAIVRDFFNDKNLPWSAVLTSYQYTSQDKIGDVLKSLECDSYCISELCGKFNAVKKL